MIAQQHSSTVLCSAGRGELFKEDCLACALEGKLNYCNIDYALMKALLTDKERTGIHVTDLTGCLRKAFYHKTTTAPEYPHNMMYRFQGTIAHGVLQFHAEADEAEVPIAALGIEGRMDIYRQGRIIDIKTTRWLTPSRLPYGSHALQVNYYAAMLRELGKPVTSAAIQYIDLSGPTKCKTCKATYVPDDTGELHCPKCGTTYHEAHTGAVLVEIPLMPHEEVRQQIIERRDALLKALDDGNAPDKEPSFLCDYCNFVEICKP